MTVLSADLFLRIRTRHGHYCAMSTLGGRLGEAALAALGAGSGDLTATYLIETCATDGIAVATGCRAEDGRLLVRNQGRHRLELRGGAGRGVAAELTAAALQLAAVCRVRLDRGEDPDVVLMTLRTCPAEELVVVTALASEVVDA